MILDLSTAHYSQIDGQSDRTIQTLKDMLHCCILDLGGNQDDYLPLMEFTYNNNYQVSVSVVPYEALYERPFRSPLCWAEPEEYVVMGPQVIEKTTEKI